MTAGDLSNDVRVDTLAGWEQWPQDRLAGSQPVSVRLPDGSCFRVNEWQQLTRFLTQWIVDRYEPPIPLRMPGSRSRSFLSSTPYHWSGEPMKPMDQVREIQSPGEVLYLFTKLDASHHLKCLCSLIRAVGEDPGRFVLSVRGAAP
jgi:hypothetical protein